MLTGRAGHRHERFPQRDQVGSDVRVVLRERTRVYARDEEAGGSEQPDRRVADERQIEVARTGTIGVERRAILPALPGNRAAAKDHPGPGRKVSFEQIEKRLEPIAAATERQPDDVVELLVLGYPALHHRALPATVHAASPAAASGLFSRRAPSPDLANCCDLGKLRFNDFRHH